MASHRRTPPASDVGRRLQLFAIMLRVPLSFYAVLEGISDVLALLVAKWRSVGLAGFSCIVVVAFCSGGMAEDSGLKFGPQLCPRWLWR